MKTTLSIVFLLTIAGGFAQESSCPTVASCISDEVESRLGKGGGGLKRLQRLRERISSLGNCDENDMDAMLEAMEQLGDARKERFLRVAQCINGNKAAEQGFPGCDFPPNMPRECKNPRELWVEARKAARRSRFSESRRSDDPQTNGGGRRGGKGGKRRRGPFKECRDESCGCPEAKLCHECYEISELHDEVHGLKLKLMSLRLKCGFSERPARRGGNPARDESMLFAFTS